MHERQTPLESIGNTPLLRLGRIGRDLPASVQLLAKAEWMNPGGSVKDRPAASMILDGEQRGYKVKLCVPANTDKALLGTLRAYGAELVLTDPAQAMDGATREAQRILSAWAGRRAPPAHHDRPAHL